MSLVPVERCGVHTVDDAVRRVLGAARRGFRAEAECHLLCQPDHDARSGEYAIITVIAPGGVDDPMPIIRAARAAAVGLDPVAAIWVLPGVTRDEGLRVYVERVGGLERAWRARGVAHSDELGEFAVIGRRDRAGDDLAYVALPTNVIAHAERYPHGPFTPTHAEIARARRTIER
jgi:hypothetical protein